MQKKLIGIVLGVFILVMGVVMGLNRDDIVEQEKLTTSTDILIKGIVETEFVSWDNFMMSDDETCEINLSGDFDDDENVQVSVTSKKGELSFDIGNAYDFSIHKSVMSDEESLFFFTGIVKEGKNITYVVKCNDDTFELKGQFYHIVDRLYTDGAYVYFYSDGNKHDVVNDSNIQLKYAYDITEMATAEVIDEGILETLHTFEEDY